MNYCVDYSWSDSAGEKWFATEKEARTFANRVIEEGGYASPSGPNGDLEPLADDLF